MVIFHGLHELTSPNVPVWLDVCAGPDVVLGGEDKLVVEYPLGLVVETGAWMQLHLLKCREER